MAFDPYHKWLGIGPAEQPADHYRLLGLTPFETDPDVISSAADQRMTHLRSFSSSPHAAESQKLLNEVATARLLLLNVQKKLWYDEELRETIRTRQAAAQPVLKAVAKSTEQQESKKKQAGLNALRQKHLVLVVAAAAGVMVLGILIYAFSGSSSSREHSPATRNEQSTAAADPGTPPPPAVVTPATTPAAPPAALASSSEASSDAASPASLPEVAPSGMGMAAPPSPVAESVETPAAENPGPKRRRSSKKASLASKTSEKASSTTAETTQTLSLPDLIEKVKPAVVVVRTDRALGSGFVVDPDGIIATNYHVVNGSSQAKVVFSNGSSLAVEGYVAADFSKDMALLRVRTDRDLLSLPVADAPPREGEDVVAMGSPEGLSFTTSQGIVSAARSIREIMQGDARLAKVLLAGGYDKDALWIQTTAPISHGSSGGPLLTRDGRVVGLNTWGQMEGQNLNFAISATHIAALLAKASGSPRALAGLPPMPRVSSSGERPRESAKMVSVKLPGGKELTEGTVGIARDWPAQFFVDDQIASTAYNNGKPQSLVHFGPQGKLVGPAATLYETGSLCTLAYYRDNVLTGPLRLWTQERQRLLYAEYKRGKKQGLCCFFRQGMPWLVQDCEKGEVSAQYLVRHADGAVTARPETELSDEEKRDFHAAVEQLTALEEQIEAGERRIKKAVGEAFREWDKEFRQARRTEIAQGHYQTARQRVENKNAASNKGQAFWRKALGNCGF